MKLQIALNGKPHGVELARIGQRLRCTIDGAPLEADAVEIAPGIYSILIDGESLEARVEPDRRGLRLTVGDREWHAEVRDPREWRRNQSGAAEAEGRQQVLAPMPGKIVRVLIGAGDAVEAKQGLFVVEAMKMQNEIRSPKSGTVERLLVKEGQTVNAGEVLAIVA
ncbi:MAG: biotin/lipoyl-containing protein [Candidatus Acidiferrales bacterium]